MAAHNAAWKLIANGSMPKRKQTILRCIQLIRAVPFPRDANTELTGMIHPAVDGEDFAPLNVTSPAFYMFDGLERSVQDIIGINTDIPEVVYPFLVNEASYYEKDVAFVVGKFVE